jgi:hypothetical protein
VIVRGVDWDIVAELADELGDRFVEQITRIYLTELPDRRAAIVEAAVDPGPELRDAAHALASTSLVVGASRLGELCSSRRRGPSG